jgi:preprotein translocase subunit SecG
MFGFFFYLTVTLFLFICLFLILLVLIQKGRGGGLASAFGGAGGNTAFGSKTGDVLTWATSIVFGLFLFLAIVLNLMSNPRTTQAQAAPEAPLLPDLPEPATTPAPTTANSNMVTADSVTGVAPTTLPTTNP